MKRAVKSRKASVIAVEVLNEISLQKKRSEVVEGSGLRPRTTGPMRDVLFVVALLSCLILTGLNLTGRMPFQTVVAAASDAEVQRIAYQTLNFAVREIDAFHRRHGQLPDSLTEVGAPADPRWKYELRDVGHYLVEFEDSGFALVYDSSRDADEFFADVRRHL